MFNRLFGRTNANRAIVEALYGQIVAASRQPQLYSTWQVPDTPLGRFEMISLHLFLFLHRVRGETGAIADVAQELTDGFFAEVEDALRGLGIGDLGVPKRMKKLARMFYGRTAAYGVALDGDDSQALADALRRNVRPEAGEWNEAGALAAYAMTARRMLAEQQTATMLGGELRYPVAG